MHVDTIRSHQKAADGTVREYRSHLLRHSFRDEQGRPRKETLANLTALPDAALEAVRTVLRGEAVVSADDAFTVERSVSHGDAAAACVMAGELGLRELLGPACCERDIAYALIVSRAVRPESKLSTVTWWGSGDTTIGADLGVADASTDEVYAAMDWLEGRQRGIEKKAAGRRARPRVGVTSRWTGWKAGSAASRRSSRPGTWPPAGSRCSTCPPRGWRAAAATWPRSGIRGTASAAASRSSTGCSPAPAAAPSRSRYSRGTPQTRSASRPRSPGSATTSASRT